MKYLSAIVFALFLFLPSAPAASMELNVFSPPTDPGQHGYDEVQTYLLNKSSAAYPYIKGAVISIDWSDFDLGDTSSGTHTKYDFTIVDGVIAPWIAAGKTVNLVLQTTPYGGLHCRPQGIGSHGAEGVGNCSMPPWLWKALGESNYTVCDNARVPNYRSSIFMTNYQAAVSALVTHYASNPNVGYFRIGLGKGGEINLPKGWQEPETACGTAYTKAWGYTAGDSAGYTWNAYLKAMLEYEGGPNFDGRTSPKQLMVSITPVRAPGATPEEVADFIAPIAAAHRIGFGNQGLSTQAMENCKGMQADWCDLFARFTGVVPLELQTLGRSCPQGASQCQSQQQGQGQGQGQSGGQRQGQGGQGWNPARGQGQGTMAKLTNQTGSLVPLLPFAIENHATILEIYTDDWLVAFSPNNPDHASFGAGYAEALRQAAAAR